MTKHVILFLCVYWFSTLTSLSVGISKNDTREYLSPKDVVRHLKDFHQKNSSNTKLYEIAVSPGNNPVSVLEIGSQLEDVPAIFVGANFEGNLPLATEGALSLAQMIMDSAQYRSNVKWYILAQPNPDGAMDYFSEIKTGYGLNAFSLNKDGDNDIDEDGPEDLNGDGLITLIRIKDIEGTFIPSESDNRILVPKKNKEFNENTFRVYTEGVDNDLDGNFNEDGKGGINPGIAFPHLFPRKEKDAGVYPGQTPEVYGILRFIYDRPEIAMVLTLGGSDFCTNPPASDKKGGANMKSIKLPGYYASRLGEDPSRRYSMDEAIEKLQQLFPDTELSPARVAGMLRLGEAVNPMKEDLDFYQSFAKEYQDYLSAKGDTVNRLSSEPAKDGSFELWAYYHLGMPSFSMNLFTVPVPSKEKENEKSEKKEKEKEKATDKYEALLKWSEDHWQGKGFIDWQSYDHPGLGKVEIGGFAPYLESTPRPELISEITENKLPWLLQLSQKLPEFRFTEKRVKELGKGLYRVDVWVENTGELAYPIAMGERNGQPAPLILSLTGNLTILEGNVRHNLGAIKAKQVKKVTWLIQTNGKPNAELTLESAVFKNLNEPIKL